MGKHQPLPPCKGCGKPPTEWPNFVGHLYAIFCLNCKKEGDEITASTRWKQATEWIKNNG